MPTVTYRNAPFVRYLPTRCARKCLPTRCGSTGAPFSRGYVTRTTTVSCGSLGVEEAVVVAEVVAEVAEVAAALAVVVAVVAREASG